MKCHAQDGIILMARRFDRDDKLERKGQTVVRTRSRWRRRFSLRYKESRRAAGQPCSITLDQHAASASIGLAAQTRLRGEIP